ncbi:MAG: rod shape-determining protein [Oscillospiraceae bacterium]|nr:rod shape-determining protein [Oscillospiraceae bacterium]
MAATGKTATGKSSAKAGTKQRKADAPGVDRQKAVDSVIPNGVDRDSLVFSLDIGTRSVVGILGYRDEDEYVVLDCEQCFHQLNAMRDGQIEDIEMVSESVKSVKDAMEKRSGMKFKKAAIAAAGRALKTINETYSRELDEDEEISRFLVDSLEYSAVAKAQTTFAGRKKTANDKFFCVGYSVISYKLDGYAYANLEEHRGKLVEIEVVAAFLPSHVIESLNAVTAKNGLEVENLTLEPIAAINVIVPKDIRLLNIAIVDIGAGTSDIAISKNGSIVAYGMATIAGDEISEAVMRTHLLGFDSAERVKIAWAKGEKEFLTENIFGTAVSLKPDDVSSAVEPVIKTLAKTVSKNIRHINGGVPMAVFLVGGGSQTPGIREEMAVQLGLTPDKIAIGGKQPFKFIRLFSDKLINPEFVTPLGIGVVSAMGRSCNFFSIKVNGSSIMAVSDGNMRVVDALLLAGVKPSRLIGYSSPPISYSVNGVEFRERGQPAEPGRILLNGVEAAIQNPVKAGDSIEITQAKDGAITSPSIADILKDSERRAYIIDGEEVMVADSAFVNGRKARADYHVMGGDDVITRPPANIKEIFDNLGKKPPRGVDYSVNGHVAVNTTPVSPGDTISFVARPKKQGAKRGRPRKSETKPGPAATATSAKPKPGRPAASVKNAESDGGMANIQINGVWKAIEKRDGKDLMFVDMLSHADIDLEQPDGVLRMSINGRNASYVDSVADGDTVEIFWETR